ncbi:hypothetical protein EDC65_5198 [Stella humosa]|uniref:Urease accessory protein UreH-like transmembrane domain-containing protein n=1 Tax=Stella humosa TaxID=94 RepID=A0A3N1KKI9_9PROT|nr:sulfite exporter TauE/SafE family protein [Stella humosa]ROP81341.1 hypothetical protein EDC65_5198 [Stella humosa]BBK32691.1 membrane protein [Stella humosa]
MQHDAIFPGLAAMDSPLLFAATMFAAGLFGGLSHCMAMCGPFVLGQVAAALPGAGQRFGTLERLRGAALVPYHLGRSTTYVLLGALGGALAGQAAAMAGSRWLPAGLLALAALLFLARGLQSLIPMAQGGGPTTWAAAALSRRLAPLLQAPTGRRSFTLGLALGFLPCGLLYGALAAAAGSGSAGGGGLGMLAFAIGTLPALFAVGFAGVFFGRRWHALARRAMPAIMLVNAAALLWFAWHQLA